MNQNESIWININQFKRSCGNGESVAQLMVTSQMLHDGFGWFSEARSLGREVKDLLVGATIGVRTEREGARFFNINPGGPKNH